MIVSLSWVAPGQSRNGGQSLAVLLVNHAHLPPGLIHDLNEQLWVCEWHLDALLQSCETDHRNIILTQSSRSSHHNSRFNRASPFSRQRLTSCASYLRPVLLWKFRGRPGSGRGNSVFVPSPPERSGSAWDVPPRAQRPEQIKNCIIQHKMALAWQN